MSRLPGSLGGVTSPHLRLPGTVIALGVVSLLTDLSSEMIYPLLPAFLATVLGAGAVAVGTVEGVAEATASVLKVISGWRSDRTERRKPLVVAGYSLSTLARPLIGTATVWPMVVFFRFADRVGKGLRTAPRDALIADTTDDESRGRAYGLHRAMDHAGAVLGPLVAAALLSLAGVGIRQVMWLAAIPGAAALVVVLTAVGDPGRRRPVRPASATSSPLPPSFRALLVAVAVFTLGNSTDAFFLLRFADAGISPALVAVLWAAHSSVKMVSTWVGGRLSDRWGRRPMVFGGWLLYAVIYLLFAVIEGSLALVVVFLAYGVSFGLTEPVERAWVADLAPTAARGSAFGWYNGVAGAGALPASIGFGFVYQTWGPGSAFGVGAVLGLVAAGLLLRVPAAIST